MAPAGSKAPSAIEIVAPSGTRSANRVAPQVGQNPRRKPGEDWYQTTPPMMLTALRGKTARAKNAWPVTFWQMRQ